MCPSVNSFKFTPGSQTHPFHISLVVVHMETRARAVSLYACCTIYLSECRFCCVFLSAFKVAERRCLNGNKTRHASGSPWRKKNKVCQNRSRHKMFGMQAVDRDVHDDAGRMVLLAVSRSVDDGPWAWNVGRHRNVASDVFCVCKVSSTSTLLGIATV